MRARRSPALVTTALVTALGLVAALSACSSLPDSESSTEDSGSWTILTYSIADTNLEDFMMNDLEEIGAVGTQEGLNLVALVDRAADYTDTDVLGLDNWVGGKTLEIGDGSATELEDMGDINTGDPAVLSTFIAYGLTNYPADHYALIISDHGASWPGVGGDESSDEDGLSLSELDTAISGGLSDSGVDQLDLLGFDACLMATYEVASALAPYARRMVASQELEPGHGWDYRAFETVADDGEATVDELAGSIIDAFAAQATDEGDEASITLSSVDLTKMDTVDAALGTFTGVLVEQASSVGGTVGRSLAGSLGFGASPDPDQDSFMTDLSMLTGQIGVDFLPASDAADDLTRAINDVVLDSVDGQATKGATGLSIYFPPTADYFSDDYRALADNGGWVAFLGSYYGEGASIPAEEYPTFQTAGATIGFDDYGLNISGIFDITSQDNLAEAYLRYGIVEADGSITYLGKEEAYLSDDGSGEASGAFDLTTLSITDGLDAADAYYEMTTDEGTGVTTFDVPMAYYDPALVGTTEYKDLLLSIVADENGDVTSETYYLYNENTGTYGEFTPKPTWIIVPQVLNVLEDGTEVWYSTSEVGLFADLPALVYNFPKLATGTQLYVELVLVDFGGNTGRVDAIVEIP